MKQTEQERQLRVADKFEKDISELREPELLTDDMDSSDATLNMYTANNGDYYLELKEKRFGEVRNIVIRISMSGGNATTSVKLAIANLYRALKGNIEPSEDSGQAELKQIIKAEHVKIMIDFPDENWQDFDEMYNGAGGIFLRRVIGLFPSSRSQENTSKDRIIPDSDGGL